MTLPIPASLLAAALLHSNSTKLQEPGTPTPPPQSLPKNYANPQMAIVFDFLGRLSDPDPEMRHVDFREVEFGFASDIDPFAKAEAYIAVARENGDTEVDIEEAFARFDNLGSNFSGKVGKVAGAIGRVQRNHRDQLDYVDYPLFVTQFLGEEGLRAPGVSVSYLFKGERFNEITLEGLDAEDGPLFAGSRADKPVIVGHYRTFFDFNDSTSAQLGVTAATGPFGDETSTLIGADYVMKYRPEGRGRTWTLEAEAYSAKPGPVDGVGSGSKFGGFVSFTYEFRPRWFATVKGDYVEVPNSSEILRALSLGATFKLTEFQLVRAEWQHIGSTLVDDRNTFTVQFQYLIGSHPAHKY